MADQTAEPTELETRFRLTPQQKRGLVKLGLKTARDLLYHFPARYQAEAPEKKIADLAVGDLATVSGQVLDSKIIKAWRKKIPIAEVTLADPSGKIKAVWYHQAYMAKKAPVGGFARLTGKVTARQGKLYLANPEIEPITSVSFDKQALFGEGGSRATGLAAIYPESRGLSSTWLRHAIQKLIRQGLAETLADPLPPELLKKYHLPKLATALVWLHAPQEIKDGEAARKRFAFEEVFFIQLDRQRHKRRYQANRALTIKTSAGEIKSFTDRFPFPLTVAQEKAIKEIVTDLGKGQPMVRLLEGDVGSGKTAVAATAAFAAVKNSGAVAYLAPTEILARQHFESFIHYFNHLGINLGLLTASDCRKFPSKAAPGQHTHISRSQLLKWVAGGEIPILVGTHALIQKAVKFKNLALTIVDEQHRFGVMQRAGLVGKRDMSGLVPHLLSMTATPIPRTLALTIYGDLDLTLLDELPAGRRPIITEIVTPDGATAVYEKIRQELKAGRQAYVICPRIDEPDPTKELALQAKSAKAEQKRLGEKIFPEFIVGLLHSKLKPKEKEEIMAEFAAGEIDLLVATSVVEVGVNVPNATVIVIEGAERFGLAQLHQLRGRVWRSSHQAYCFLMTEAKSGQGAKRLAALARARSGFELAEKDLELRGAGTLAGAKQWGLSDIGMEAIKNLKMVEAARVEAAALLVADPELTSHPLIEVGLRSGEKQIHFE